MKTILIMAVLLALFVSVSAAPSKYQGLEHREIKALSKSEIDGYLAGGGMGYAKAAELNHYPGPKHVLEIAIELELNELQLTRSRQIFESMQARAAQLGRQLVDRERELDRLFASSSITPESLKNKLSEIAALESQIRFAHLGAHLEQKVVLSDQQALQYDQLRGYANGHNSHEH